MLLSKGLNDAELGLADVVPTLEQEKAPARPAAQDSSSDSSCQKKESDLTVTAQAVAIKPKPAKKKVSRWTLWTLWFNTYR